MLYRVRVKDGRIFGGYTTGDAKLNILPGEYDVDKISNGDLLFKCAVKRDNADLTVRKGEYVELDEFPDVDSNPYLEVLE